MAMNDVGVEGILDVGVRIAQAIEPLDVGLVVGQQPHRQP